MTRTEIAKKYLSFLEEGQTDKVISLFAEKGLVSSPIYGIQKAAEFYQTLADDTTSSELKLIDIFQNNSKNSLALYFEYRWTLKSGSKVSFDVVDILEFDSDDKILHLKIIYDTTVSRKLVNEIRET